MRRVAVVAVALALLTSLWVWWPWQTETRGAAVAEGKLLTATGREVPPEQVASLRVATWSESEGGPEVFEVAKKAGDWIIPSHFDYPADGGTRVGRTAGAVLNVPRGPLVTADIKKHAELGVVDPLDEGATGGEGRGKSVTLEDEGGAPLVDIVIGKRAEHANVYYVREAGRDAVYTADVNPDIRTSFRDWVKTDLLEINRADIRSIIVLDESVDEARGILVKRSDTTFTKGEKAAEWSSRDTPRGKKVKQETLDALVDEVTTLRLVGVRPYSNLWLQARGFYVLMDGRLAGNEGSLQIQTKDGLIYHLFFGEIALGDEEDTAAEVEPGKLSGGDATSHNRYMAAFVQYVPGLDETRGEPETGGGPEEKAGEGGGAKPGAGEERDKDGGRKRAEKEQQRFGRFFYVIGDDSFRKLRPPASELFERK